MCHQYSVLHVFCLQVLKERLGVHCILGLTATATRTTALSVGKYLGIVEGDIIIGTTLPDNLQITVSCDQDREQVVTKLTTRAVKFIFV